ncbi:MAG TPA: hypothetical protein VFZ08_06295, partial [Terriglobia bacterium]|nr:hypothetical protein [Terriglobia bacterium]
STTVSVKICWDDDDCMRILKVAIAAILSTASLAAQPRVFVQWTQPSIPSAESLGVRDVAIPWAAEQGPLLAAAKHGRYQIYAEVTPDQAPRAARTAAREGLTGIIVIAPGAGPEAEQHLGVAAGQDNLSALMRRLKTSYPSLAIERLAAGGKQPQMRGSMVVGKDGILEVSRPSEQPWIDSNVALVRFEEARFPGETPLISFKWNLIDPSEQRYGPPPSDYKLAVAEAGSFHADLILPLHPRLQQDLTERKPQAWRAWAAIRRYIRFYSPAGAREGMRPIGNVGVITDSYESSYEAANLLARHNIPFRVLPPAALENGNLKNLALVAVFNPMDAAAARSVEQFAANGGSAVLVGQHGAFPWHSSPPVHKSEDAAVYVTGKGKVAELAAPVSDPEAFARDVWRMLRPPQRELSLWNALTTLAVAYQTRGASDVRLNLVNFSGGPLRVQVRVKGNFSKIRFATPEDGCCTQLKPEQSRGFTEFVTPSFRTGAVARLSVTASD